MFRHPGWEPNLKNVNGRTFLMRALNAGNERVAKILLTYGFDPDHADTDGANVLCHAAGISSIRFASDIVNLASMIYRKRNEDRNYIRKRMTAFVHKRNRLAGGRTFLELLLFTPRFLIECPELYELIETWFTSDKSVRDNFEGKNRSFNGLN